jgi:hypothetical protein
LDSPQLNLDFSSEAVRLLTFEDAKKMELKLVPLMPPWFRRVPVADYGEELSGEKRKSDC